MFFHKNILWVLINEYPQHMFAILMSTHNVSFYGKLMKIIP